MVLQELDLKPKLKVVNGSGLKWMPGAILFKILDWMFPPPHTQFSLYKQFSIGCPPAYRDPVDAGPPQSLVSYPSSKTSFARCDSLWETDLETDEIIATRPEDR